MDAVKVHRAMLRVFMPADSSASQSQGVCDGAANSDASIFSSSRYLYDSPGILY
jgi:hypothetical protein